jgi:hypothetical protein
VPVRIQLQGAFRWQSVHPWSANQREHTRGPRRRRCHEINGDDSVAADDCRTHIVVQIATGVTGQSSGQVDAVNAEFEIGDQVYKTVGGRGVGLVGIRPRHRG